MRRMNTNNTVTVAGPRLMQSTRPTQHFNNNNYTVYCITLNHLKEDCSLFNSHISMLLVYWYLADIGARRVGLGSRMGLWG